MGMVVAAVVETTSTWCFKLLDHALVGEQREIAIYRSPADAAVVAPDLDEHIVGGRMAVVQGSNGIEDEPALIVERYDRVRDVSGAVVRLHQEDLCQALSVMPDSKYTEDGGPAARDVLWLLAGTSHHELNLLTFSHQLFYNALVGAPDAHAKNYSLLLGNRGSSMLAPMYDVASGLAYENLRRRLRLAMSIGGENRVERIGSGELERYVGGGDPELAALLARAGLTLASCRALMADLAQEIPVSMAEVFEESAALPGADELREHLLGLVSENCRHTLALL